MTQAERRFAVVWWCIALPLGVLSAALQRPVLLLLTGLTLNVLGSAQALDLGGLAQESPRSRLGWRRLAFGGRPTGRLAGVTLLIIGVGWELAGLQGLF